MSEKKGLAGVAAAVAAGTVAVGGGEHAYKGVRTLVAAEEIAAPVSARAAGGAFAAEVRAAEYGADAAMGAGAMARAEIQTLTRAPTRAALLAIRDAPNPVETAAKTVVESAKPALVNDIGLLGRSATAANVEPILTKDLKEAATLLAKTDAEHVTFEVLTGKLKVSTKLSKNGYKLAFGEVNLYKVVSVSAATVAACNRIHRLDTSSCIDAALDKALSLVEIEQEKSAVAKAT